MLPDTPAAFLLSPSFVCFAMTLENVKLNLKKLIAWNLYFFNNSCLRKIILGLKRRSTRSYEQIILKTNETISYCVSIFMLMYISIELNVMRGNNYM